MTALAAAAAAAAVPAPAGATDVGVRVVNRDAPAVALVTPADGARLVAGRAITLRAASARADRLILLVDGAGIAEGPGGELTARWTPRPGAAVIVALARREGAPDALARARVRASSASQALPGAAPPQATDRREARRPDRRAAAPAAPARPAPSSPAAEPERAPARPAPVVPDASGPASAAPSPEAPSPPVAAHEEPAAPPAQAPPAAITAPPRSGQGGDPAPWLAGAASLLLLLAALPRRRGGDDDAMVDF